MAVPYAHAMLNNLLPKELQLPQTAITKKILKKSLVQFAKTKPVEYARVVPHIKELGDEWATYEGIRVGLDDITPDYAKRDKIINAAEAKINKLSTTKERLPVYIKAQADIRKVAINHKGDLGLMARSGGRGNVNQLMKSIATPVVVGDMGGNPVDTLIKRSYSEGLSPAEYWVAGDESRSQVIKGQLGTAAPGDVSKILSNIVNTQVIASADCGTKNGIRKAANDPQSIGRYLARDQKYGKRNEEVTQRIVTEAKSAKLFVRSPLTCEAPNGVCSFCQGLMNDGKRMEIGEKAGLQGAQAISEPLTQMALSSKNGISLVEGVSNIPTGLYGFRQFLDIPKNFLGKATVSNINGQVNQVKEAPQGGHYIHVGKEEHYLPPTVRPTIKVGQNVEKGDALSSGVPNPAEVVQYKGLGAGRKYMVDQIQNIYQDSGVDIDVRHVENLVSKHLNHAKVEKAPSKSGLLTGDIVEQSRLDKLLRPMGSKMPTQQSHGRIISENYLHHTAGTPVTKSMMDEFHDSGITQVNVLPEDDKYKFEAFMTPSTRSPLLNTNWLGKLGHRYLKSSILQAAHQGETAETSGYDPVAAYVRGTSFGRGKDGRY